jgi:hypothetical protein
VRIAHVAPRKSGSGHWKAHRRHARRQRQHYIGKVAAEVSGVAVRAGEQAEPGGMMKPPVRRPPDQGGYTIHRGRLQWSAGPHDRHDGQ